MYSRQAKGGGGRILLERAALSGSRLEEDFVADGRAAFCVLKPEGKESTGEFVVPFTRPAGKCGMGKMQLFTYKSSASARPPQHLCRACGAMN